MINKVGWCNELAVLGWDLGGWGRTRNLPFLTMFFNAYKNAGLLLCFNLWLN